MDATATFLVGQQKALEAVLTAFVNHIADRPAWTTDDPSRVRFDGITDAIARANSLITKELSVR